MSQYPDDSALTEAFPGEPENEGVELGAGEADGIATFGPDELTLIEPAGGEPDAEAIVDEEFDPAGAGVGEEIGSVRLGGTEDEDDLGEQAVNAGSHVSRGGSEPQGVDADHASHSRSQAPQSLATSTGQSILSVASPR